MPSADGLFALTLHLIKWWVSVSLQLRVCRSSQSDFFVPHQQHMSPQDVVLLWDFTSLIARQQLQTLIIFPARHVTYDVQHCKVDRTQPSRQKKNKKHCIQLQLPASDSCDKLQLYLLQCEGLIQGPLMEQLKPAPTNLKGDVWPYFNFQRGYTTALNHG